MSRWRMHTLKRFIRQRNRIFLSLDEGAIRQFLMKHKMYIPADGIPFWYMVHKTITNMNDIDPVARETSERWIHDHVGQVRNFLEDDPEPYVRVFA